MLAPMIRRILATIILLSMVLHCASRLGILSYLYKNRNELAYIVGLVSEVPIALCSSDYDFNEGLHIQQADTQPGTPASFLTAQEITLFYLPPFSVELHTNSVSKNTACPTYKELTYTSPLHAIFQPPRIS